MFFGDFTMIILLPALILSMYAQAKVSSTFQKYLRVPAKGGLTGADVARQILRQSGINDVSVDIQGGRLSDHYDPRQKVVRLSRDVFNGRSLAALGVAAHECGHALQHEMGYIPLSLRTAFVPVANIGSQMAFPMFFIGLIFRADFLLTLGIIMFSAAVLFQIITLPVEFNASNRAVAVLEGHGFIDRSEVGPVKQVLSAAALTYVSATLMAVLQLVRLLIIAGAGRNRR